MKMMRYVVLLFGCLATFLLPQPARGATSETLAGWFDVAQSWGGTIQGSNSKYIEGDTIPLRFVASLPSGSTHTILLKYDFSSGGTQRFFDSVASYNASVQNADPTLGLTGLGSRSQWPIPLDASLPLPAQTPASLRLLTTYNISAATSVGTYTLTNGVKALRFNFTVASGGGSKTVVIAYGTRLANETGWGAGNGASHFPGASTKAYASLDGNSDKNVSVNPTAIVVDLTPPTITCPADIIRSTDANKCSAVVTYTVTATDDNPGVTVVSNPPSGSTFPKGTNTVLCTATDASGNTASCSFRIIVRDTQNPVITCPSTITKSNDPGQCSAQVTFGATATDNCDVPSVVYRIGATVITSPRVFPLGTTTVTATATDGSGNSASCSFDVKVNDTEPPKPNCPALITAPTDAGQCSAGVNFAAAPTDNCGLASTVYKIGTTVITSPYVFPVGVTTVDVTVTDVNSNTANCSFQVAVVEPLNISWPQALSLTLVNAVGTQQGSFSECVTATDQSRWFKFKVKPGSRLIVTLTGLPANYDLVLFKDIAKTYAELTSLNSQQDLLHLSAEFASDAFSPAAFSSDAFSPAAFSPAAFSPAAFSPAAFSPAAFSPAAFSPAAFSPAAFSPDAFAPAAFSPAAFSPAAFSPAAFSPAAFSPAAFSPAAFSAAQIQSVLAVSAFDGVAGEGIIANTWDNDGDFYVRVRGRNGVFSTSGPFQLQVFIIEGGCDNVSSVPLDAQNQPLPSSTFAAPSGNYKTIILTDLNRLVGPGPSQTKTDLQNKLATFAARTEVKGVVVDVSADPWVSFFNAQADLSQNLDCPFAKNLVAGAIQDIVDRSRAGNAFEYVVVVGSDAVIPFFRYPDEALLGPEKQYFPPVRDFTPSQASLRLNYVLGQDQYGADCTVSTKFTTIPVPGLAVGRLVESPSNVMAMLDAYLETTGGIVPTPTNALVTGYDFLEDVANAVRTNLTAGLGAGGTIDALILNHTNSPTSPLAWTADDLRAQLLGKRHDLIFLAGHFSANAALASDYSTHMFSTELVNSTVNLKNAILFSPGCHSGYNTVDAEGIPFVTLQPDWASALAAKQATLLAGTGYQYGDTDFIEYSEKLYLEFSKQLRAGTGPVSVGKALVRAKELYLATTPQLRGIQQKSFLEATLFGLPMLSVNMPGTRLPSNADQSIVPATQPFATNPGLTLGLTFANVTVTPTLTPHQVLLTNLDEATTATATYLSGNDGILNNPTEPILPLEVRNVSVSGTVLRGVGFRGGTYTDVANILPLTGAPTTEIRGVHAAFLSDSFYPIKPWSVNYFDALCNTANATRLLLLPAQFISGSSASPTGTLREYQTMDFRLFYSANTTTYTSPTSDVPSTPALSGPPSISSVSGVTVGANVLLSARVTGNPAAGIQQVWVTYSAQSGPFAGRWQSLDLVQNAADSTLWAGTLPLNGTIPEDVRYMVQAVNGVGAVALDAKLGAYHVPDETDGTGAPTTVTLLSPPTTGPYGTLVTFQARLTSGASPLGTRRLRFSLGDQELQGITDANGIATVKLNLLTVPGSYEIKVTFGGATGYAPSFATSPFTITKQTTVLSLSPLTSYARPDVDTKIVATLVDPGNTPILERTVFFVVTGTGGSNSVVDITDFLGRARLGSVRLPGGSVLPDGTYTVKVYFGGTVPLPFPPPNSSVDLSDERYVPSSATSTLIIDSQKPVMTNPTTTPSVLQPPNHKMTSVTVSASATDNNGPVSCKIVSVASNEPINGTGDGDQEPDWIITGDLTLDLRAERAQNGTGRIYTITVECKDLAGNVTTKTVTVSVPK